MFDAAGMCSESLEWTDNSSGRRTIFHIGKGVYRSCRHFPVIDVIAIFPECFRETERANELNPPYDNDNASSIFVTTNATATALSKKM